MSIELALVLALLFAAIVMFAIDRPRMDAVALLMLTLLPFVGMLTGKPVVSMNEALAGFADPNVVLIVALFVLGDGLVRTGVARKLGDWLTARAAGSDTMLLVLLMSVVCGLGATMSSTAVTAIFIPVALRIARSTGTAPSRLLMPLSMAALISGMMTLVATAPNLVVNAELERHGDAGFRFFSFTPFGLPILALGIVHMLCARNWLSGGGESKDSKCQRPSLSAWIEEYHLAGREYRFGVRADSPLVGQTVAEIRLKETSGASLIAVERDSDMLEPTPQFRFQAGDILLVDLLSERENIPHILDRYRLDQLPLAGAYFSDRTQDIGMAELMVPVRSELIGKTAVTANLRDRLGLSLVGIRRGVHAIHRPIRDEKLKLGDTLLVIGRWQAIENVLTQGRDLVILNLPVELEDALPAPNRARYAVACLALVIGLMIFGVLPNVQAALIGCLLMGLCGCVTLNSGYRSIDWKTIVLIVGMLPFSLALQRTRGVELAAGALMSVTADLGPHGVLASLFIVTVLLGMFISNTATAVLMAPVALAVAEDFGASPYPFAMIVALAASTAFMTPVSSPVNTLVVTPGNYTFRDFLKVGAPFSLIVLVVSVILVPILLPLAPAAASLQP